MRVFTYLGSMNLTACYSTQMLSNAKTKISNENFKHKSKQKIYSYYNKKANRKESKKPCENEFAHESRLSDTSDFSSSNNFIYSDIDSISNQSSIVKFERKKLLKLILREEIDILVSRLAL